MRLGELGKTLLDAARLGQTEVVQVLLLNGALFTTDWLGNSPLHCAAQNGHVEMCKILIRAGINSNARTKVDRTPLHLAAQEGHSAIVELLVSNGADLHASDMIGMTALHWAVQKGHTHIVSCLVQHGANACWVNKFGKTPVDIGVDCGYTEIVSQLTQHSALTTTTTSVESCGVDDAVEKVTSHDVATDETQCRMFISDDLHSVSSAETVVETATGLVDSRPVSVSPSQDAGSAAAGKPPMKSEERRQIASDTLTWLETHGVTVDNCSVVTAMLNTGQTVVLTEDVSDGPVAKKRKSVDDVAALDCVVIRTDTG